MTHIDDIHGPYETARLVERPASALLVNGGRHHLIETSHDIAAWLAARLNERDHYHRALTTIAKAGAADPEFFAGGVLDGLPHDVALMGYELDGAAENDPDQSPYAAANETLSVARDTAIAAALSGDAAQLESAVMVLRLTLAVMGR